MSLKRLQYELQRIWLSQVRNEALSHNSMWQRALRLRSEICFIVDNLLSYIQMDALESQFNKLIKNVEKLKDFEQVRHSHDTYLSNLLQQFFLNMPRLMKCIKDIMRTGRDLCFLLNRLESNFEGEEYYENEEIQWEQKDQDLFDNIQERFQNTAVQLFDLLNAIKTTQSSQALAQLMLRLDFNRYYSHQSELRNHDFDQRVLHGFSG
mmetsp:Transcript_28352/g.32469  ORF Transcript_28352/g.32469 Transcript_28352/m.32469 type:complete len:208 (+) Transcript_28352:1-624(+)